VQAELLPGHVVEAAEIDVVAARLEAGAHRIEVDPVGGRVDQDVDVGELLSETLPGVRRTGGRLAAAEL
jgi:hypothetical protein